MEVGDLIMTLGDAHLYKNHFEQANLQLTREEKELPTLELNKAIKSIFDFNYEDIVVKNYNPHPAIKAPVAV